MEFNLAEKLAVVQAKAILQRMSEQKKQLLAKMLREMANADENIDKKEMQVIVSIFTSSGIDILSTVENKVEFDVSDIYFKSSDHIKYKNGKQVAIPSGDTNIAIKIETHIDGIEGYSVTSYNLDDVPPIWGNNIDMCSKQMKIIDAQSNKTVLRGFGEDPSAMGHPEGVYSNFGATILHPSNEIEKIILHFYNHNIDIEYLK